MRTKRKPRRIGEVAWGILKKRGIPLHYTEITRLVMRKRPLTGRTPANSVRARLGSDPRFKRVAEGVYALAEWSDYPVARFAKDIAYDALKTRGSPISPTELGTIILKERQFESSPGGIARGATDADGRFYYDPNRRLIGLTEWRTRHREQRSRRTLGRE